MTLGIVDIPGDIANTLKVLAEYGVWDILTLVSAVSISVLLGLWYRRRIPGLSVHLTYSIGTGHHLYPNTLNFEVRNLRDSPLLILNPNFRFSRRLAPGQNAHGNSATGDFEVKFRVLSSDGRPADQRSQVTEMLRHRQSAFAYIPIDESLDEAKFVQILKAGSTGKLYLHIVLIGTGKPRVVSMVIPMKGITRLPHKPPLGGTGHPKAEVPEDGAPLDKLR